MAQYSSILRDEYNNIQTAVANILGTGTGDSGYGQSVASSQILGNPAITATQWQNLTKDVLRCLYHQNGTNLQNQFISTGTVNGQGVTSGYPYTATVTTNATATSAITNRITVTSTAGISFGMQIVFTGTTFGNIVANTTYYVLTIISGTELSICSSIPSNTSAAFVLTTSTGSMTATASGSKGQYILDADRAKLVSYTTTGNPGNIVDNRLIVPPSTGVPYVQGTLYQYAVTNQLPAIKSGALSPWTGTIFHAITIPFGSHDAARYFFNSGGYFAFKWVMSDLGNPGDPGIADPLKRSYQLNLTWSTMFTAMDTFIFRATTCDITGTAQTTGTGTTYSKLNGGFYNLGVSPSTVLALFAPTGTYSVNDAQITASYDGGGNLYFNCIFNDDYAPTGFGIQEKVTGTLTSTLSVFYADGKDADGNNTVVIARPSATSTSFN